MNTALARWRELVASDGGASSNGFIGLMAQGLLRTAATQDVRQSPAFRDVLNHLGPERTVVDIGAGVGRYTLPLAEDGCRVWAVEPSGEMRAHLGRALAERAPRGRVQVVAGVWPGAMVPVAEVALASFVIQFSADPIGFLRAMEEVATHRCVLAIHVDDPEPAEIQRLWAAFHPERPAPRRPRLADLYPLMLEEGIVADVRIAQATVGPGEYFWASLDQLLPPLAALLQIEGDAAAQAHLADLVAAHRGSAGEDGLRIRLPGVREAVVSWTPSGGPG